MDVLAVLIILAVLAAVIAVVSGPLRSGRVVEERDAARLADLRAAREAKYREIRDAEIDYRTGKLSEADYRALDRELRAEAIVILRELDTLEDAPRAGERPF